VRAKIIPKVVPETIPVVVYHGEFTLSHAEFDTLLRPLMGNGNILAGIGDDFNTPITMADVTSTHVHLDWSYSRNARIAGPDEDQSQVDPLYIPCSTGGFSSKSPSLPLDALAAELAPRSLAHPWSEILSPVKILSGDYKIVYWTSRCVTVSHEEEMTSAAKSSGVVFVGDAWHAMPIFGGEGGNHALVDAVELWEEIVTAQESGSAAGLTQQGAHIIWEIKAAEKYYSRAFARCQDAVRRSKQRFQVLHRPMSQWMEIRKKSEMMLKLMEKQQQGREVTNRNDRDAAVAVSATA
jgi:monooxygenase